MRSEHAGIVMPVTSRPGHQRGEPVEQLERGEGELGLAGGQGLGEALADGLIGAVPAESFTGEGGTGAVAQPPFEAGAVRSLDQDGGVQREPAAVAPAGEVGGDLGSEGAVADGERQHPAADPPLHGAECGCIEISGGVEMQRAGRREAEHPVGDAAVQVSVSVETDQGSERASALIIASGAWTSRLIPELTPLLEVTRQVQAWIAPADGIDASSMPSWLFDRWPGQPAIYGLAPDPTAPASADGSVSPSRHPKVAFHGSDVLADPDLDAAPVATSDVARLLEGYRSVAPGLAGSPVAAATCLYTMSPDGHFLVGTRRGLRRTHFAAGLSGHGFKLAPALGDALVDLALQGRTDLPIGFLSPARLKSIDATQTESCIIF